MSENFQVLPACFTLLQWRGSHKSYLSKLNKQDRIVKFPDTAGARNYDWLLNGGPQGETIQRRHPGGDVPSGVRRVQDDRQHPAAHHRLGHEQQRHQGRGIRGGVQRVLQYKMRHPEFAWIYFHNNVSP